MQLPKLVAVAVCTVILGAQLRASFPITRVTNGWYWPFLSYPMYAIAHERTDSLLVPELRVTTCEPRARARILTAYELGPPQPQLTSLLLAIARDSASAHERPLREKMARVLDARFPGQFCSAAVWTRTVFVDDAATQHLRAPMRRVAEWTMSRTSGE